MIFCSRFLLLILYTPDRKAVIYRSVDKQCEVLRIKIQTCIIQVFITRM